jgi:hypothetical protein
VPKELLGQKVTIKATFDFPPLNSARKPLESKPLEVTL